jgi:hypothetical protein
MTSAPVKLPDWVEAEVALAPIHSTKKELADLISKLFGRISPRTVETRPLVWRVHNGKAVTETRPAIAAEWERFKTSPEYRVAGAREVA